MNIDYLKELNCDLKDNYNEYDLLELLKKIYELTTTKKNRSKTDIIIKIGYSIIDEIDKWNTENILNIILNGDYDLKKDDNILFLLNMIDYLCDNNKIQIKYYLLDLISCINIYS